MREIKFRAWVKNLDTNKFQMHLWNINFFADYSPVTGYGDEFPDPDDPDRILMQFTGLKDKNGKEIYEGDVAEYEAWTGLDRGEIVWGEKECAFFWAGKTDCQPLGDIYQDIEIIGNIYENPELLK